MRVLGVDPGTVRVGLALSDERGAIASPHATLQPRGREHAVQLVAVVVRETGAERVVVGLPLRLDGGESESSRRARWLAARIGEVAGVPVALWDERLTSVAAERHLADAGARGKKRRGAVDRVAAALLLQSYLDAQGAGAWPSSPE
jgi:putative Holliday junction resolvase